VSRTVAVSKPRLPASADGNRTYTGGAGADNRLRYRPVGSASPSTPAAFLDRVIAIATCPILLTRTDICSCRRCPPGPSCPLAFAACTSSIGAGMVMKCQREFRSRLLWLIAEARTRREATSR